MHSDALIGGGGGFGQKGDNELILLPLILPHSMAFARIKNLCIVDTLGAKGILFTLVKNDLDLSSNCHA